MKKITIEIPTTKKELKEFEKGIIEIDKGALKEVNRMRKFIDKEFSLGYKKPLFFPLCCETCKFEGGAFWHCHNPKSPKCYINVNRSNVCSHYSFNWGLMTLLWYRAWNEENKKRRIEDIEFMNKLKEVKNGKNRIHRAREIR